jgi:uncharacterized membrane protein (DUF373 family)
MTMIELEDAVREKSYSYVHFVELILYATLAMLFSAGAIAALATACYVLWKGLMAGIILTEVFSVLEQLLLVLIFLEILHTVRISIRSETLLMEPFLFVGLIASVRRVLVITMQAAKATHDGKVDPASAELFRNSMIELGLLGFLIILFALSIYLLRKAPSPSAERLAA